MKSPRFAPVLASVLALTLASSPFLFAGPAPKASTSAPATKAAAPPPRTSTVTTPTKVAVVAPSGNKQQSGWSNPAVTSKATAAAASDGDDAIATKMRQSGEYGKTRNDAFPVSTPRPAVAASSAANSSDDGGLPIPVNTGQSRSYGGVNYGSLPSMVVIHNRPTYLAYNAGMPGVWDGPNFVPYNPVAMQSYSTGGGGVLHFFAVLMVLVVVAALVGVIVYVVVNRNKMPRVDAKLRGTEPRNRAETSDVDLSDQAQANLNDPHKPDFWPTVQAGSNIILSDAISGAMGKEYRVERVATLTQRRGLAKWLFFYFKDEATTLLMVRMVDGKIAVSRLDRTDFNPQTRQEIIDGGFKQFFVPPEDETHFQAETLQFARQFTPWYSGDDKYQTHFIQKSEGEVHGTYSQRPAPTGQSEALLATLVEYDAAEDSPVPDPQYTNFVLLETGASAGTGVVETFMAAHVRFSEMTVEKSA